MTYFSGKFERRRARFPDSKSMAWEFFTDDDKVLSTEPILFEYLATFRPIQRIAILFPDRCDNCVSRLAARQRPPLLKSNFPNKPQSPICGTIVFVVSFSRRASI